MRNNTVDSVPVIIDFEISIRDDQVELFHTMLNRYKTWLLSCRDLLTAARLQDATRNEDLKVYEERLEKVSELLEQMELAIKDAIP